MNGGEAFRAGLEQPGDKGLILPLILISPSVGSLRNAIFLTDDADHQNCRCVSGAARDPWVGSTPWAAAIEETHADRVF